MGKITPERLREDIEKCCKGLKFLADYIERECKRGQWPVNSFGVRELIKKVGDNKDRLYFVKEDAEYYL